MSVGHTSVAANPTVTQRTKWPRVIPGGRGWRGAKLGLTGLKSRPPKERFCCAHAAFFSPPCEGGVGGVGQTASASPGVGRRTSASSVYSPFARNDVRKRHALKAGEAAHAPSTSSIDRAQHGSLVHSKLTGPPPLTPPSQGGERRRHARGICATNSEGMHEWCNPNFAPRQGEAPSEPDDAAAQPGASPSQNRARALSRLATVQTAPCGSRALASAASMTDNGLENMRRPLGLRGLSRRKFISPRGRLARTHRSHTERTPDFHVP